MGRPVEIKLTVEASSLYGITTTATQAEIDARCSIFDDTPERPPYTGTNEDFTSDVYVGNTVKWKGQTNGDDSGYAVAITSVVYEPDTEDPDDVTFFTSPLAGQPTNGRNSTASATISQGVDGKHDVYTINFRVYSTGQNYKDFSIDPKLSGKAN